MIKNLFNLLIILSCFASYAADIYVDISAPSGGNGASWSTAFQNIENAVLVANSGDNILIAEGVYKPVNTITVSENLSFIGGYPSGGGIQNTFFHVTQVQADFDPANLLIYVFEIQANSQTSFRGMTFFNAASTILSFSDISLTEVNFKESWGALVLEGTINQVIIDNCFFDDLSGDIIRSFPNTTIQLMNILKSTFQNNFRAILKVDDALRNFNLDDCVIKDFNSISDSLIRFENTVVDINNLEVFNHEMSLGTIISFGDSDLTITNSVFRDSAGSGASCIVGARSTLNISNCSFTNNSNSTLGGTNPVLGTSDTDVIVSNTLFDSNLALELSQEAIGSFLGGNSGANILFENCIFSNNEASGPGSGILRFDLDIDVIILNCVFDGNTSNRQNIGIISLSPNSIQLINNVFRNHVDDLPLLDTNHLGVRGDITLSRNSFYNNAFTKIKVHRFDSLELEDNSFIGDNVNLDIDSIGFVSLLNDYFRGNATNSIFLNASRSTMSIDQMLMISRANSGSHELIDSFNNVNLDINNSTFSSSVVNGPDVFLRFDSTSTLELKNSIIWSNTSNLINSGLQGNTSNLNVNYSLVRGTNPSGIGNLDGTIPGNQPVFVNESNFDFRMQRCSPTINKGLNSYSSQPSDLSGNLRVFENIIDLGAYEIQQPFDLNCISPPVPSCTSLSNPISGAVDVDPYTSISWNPVSDAMGYLLLVGTSAGSSNLINETLLSNQTTYNLSSPLPINSQIYVKVIPFNGSGNAIACVEEDFLTVSTPECTTLINPINGAVDILITSDIEWNIVSGASGYLISIGTNPGATNILNNYDNGISTVYTTPSNFLENTTYYVTVFPYNSVGNAQGCAEISFTTEIISIPPPCTGILSPMDGSINVSVDTDINWSPVPTATGYIVNIGTSTGASDILSNFDNGNSTTYNPLTDFSSDTTYYLTVVPYNASGNALGCQETDFTTEVIPSSPDCTAIISPINLATGVPLGTNISWNTVPTATGYLINIGTSTGALDFLNNFDNGNNTSFNTLIGFAPNTTYYITILPYNVTGSATDCQETSFTTEELTVIVPSEFENNLVIPLFFTPNQDGFNDIWRIEDPDNLIAQVFVFDRYGKLLKQCAVQTGWDGTFSGNPLPSSDYWYTIFLRSGELIKGHFTLKR